MNKRTKALRFSPQTKQALLDRDKGCFFCMRGIHMDKVSNDSMSILDAMHVVNKSQGGLGVIQNGIIGCRGHHHLLDNSEYGPQMRKILMDYLKIIYPGWTMESVTYNKFKDLVVYRKRGNYERV